MRRGVAASIHAREEGPVRATRRPALSKGAGSPILWDALRSAVGRRRRAWPSILRDGLRTAVKFPRCGAASVVRHRLRAALKLPRRA